MREILFRGKRVDNNEWVYGFLSKSRGNNHFLSLCIDHEENGVMLSSIVEPETIGQYTGLTDRNGVKIFEWDIVRHYSGGKIEDDVGKIFYDTKNCKFLRTSKTNPKIHYELHADLVYEVIGNIYDNPELVEAML